MDSDTVKWYKAFNSLFEIRGHDRPREPDNRAPLSILFLRFRGGPGLGGHVQDRGLSILFLRFTDDFRGAVPRDE